MKTSNTILGVVSGLAIGAVVGVLFAPDKGSNTRKKIVDKSSDAANELKTQFDKAVNTVAEKYNTLLNKGEAIADKGKKEFNNLEYINR